MSMIQPLSGDNSVLGSCLISGGGSISILTTSGYVSSSEIGWQMRNSPFLDQVLAIIRAQADRLILQIVQGPNQSDGLALRPHQDRMGHGGCFFFFFAAQKSAIAGFRRAQNNVLALSEIVVGVNSVEFFLPTVGDELFLFLLIARPHFRLHLAAERFDSGRGEHSLGRSADSHVKIDLAFR